MTSLEYLTSKKITPVIRIVAGSNKAEAFVTMTIEQFEEYAEYCADKAYGDGYTDALRDRPRRNIDMVVTELENHLPTDVELALKISKLVHNECANAPHDIGLKVVELIRKEKTYTAEDMEDFARWCSYMGWFTGKDTGIWWNRNYKVKDKTTAQLRELWERERRSK